MVGRVSNEAVTAVGLFWRQPLPDTAMKDSPWYVYRDNKDGGAAKSKKANPGDVIFAITSKNIEDVCTPLA